MSPLRELLLHSADYTAWAIGEVLLACSALQLVELTRDLGASHASIQQTLCHMYDAERVWLLRLEAGTEGGLPAGCAPQLDFAKLLAAWPQMSRKWKQWLEQASETALSEPITTLLPDGKLWHHSRAEIVLHVTTHASLHRGQIVTMLRALGRTPPNTDFTAFGITR